MAGPSPRLNIVRPPPAAVPSLAERIARLQAEARSLATEHVAALTRALADVEAIATEIADGGDAYPVGIREIARRLSADAEAAGLTIQAIGARR